MEPHSLTDTIEAGSVSFFQPNETISPITTSLGFSEFLSKPKSIMDIENLHLKGRAPLNAEAKALSVLSHTSGIHDARIIRTDDIEIDDVVTPGVGDTLYRLSLFLPHYTEDRTITIHAFHPGGPYMYEAQLRPALFEALEDEEQENGVYHGTTEKWKVIDPKTHHIIAENVELFAEPDAKALSKLRFTFSQ